MQRTYLFCFITFMVLIPSLASQAQTMSSALSRDHGKAILFQNSINSLSIHPFNQTSKTRSSSGWVSYQDAIYRFGQSTALLYPVYPDSNLIYTIGQTNYNWWLHMLGTSFDPVSQKLYDGLLGYISPVVLTNFQNFCLDSIQIAGKYYRNKNQNDTLFIDISITNNLYCDTLTSQPSQFFKDSLHQFDSTLSFVNSVYEASTNQITSPNVTLKVLLNQATYADTTSNGLNIFKINLPTPLAIPPGNKIMAAVRFKPQNNSVLGTPMDSANYWAHYCMEELGDALLPAPYNGEFVTGLSITTAYRYKMDSLHINGNSYMRPTYFNSDYLKYDDPFFSFYISCGPNNIEQNAKENDLFKIFPNPLHDNLSILNRQNLDFKLAIYSVTGRKLLEENFNKKDNKVNISIEHLPRGTYICYLSNKNFKTQYKILKE